MFRSKLKLAMVLGIVALLAAPLTACKQQPPPMPKIDLAQVDEAFRTSTGSTFSLWMMNFEWAVNEIYAGKELVSVDARRYGAARRMLVVYGYIEKNKRSGYQATDELIFKIKQVKGTWKFKYQVEDHIGWAPIVRTYRTAAPAFPFYGSVILVSTWRPYYTPRSRYRTYRTRRAKYRSSKAYKKRRARAKKFRSKAKKASKSRSKARRSSRRRGGKF